MALTPGDTPDPNPPAASEPAPTKRFSFGRLFVLGGGTVLVLVFVVVVASFFTTVSYEDAAVASKRLSAMELTDPRPGKLFVFRDGEIEDRPVCHIVLGEGDILGQDAVHRYEFVNVVGRLAPIVAGLSAALTGGEADMPDVGDSELFKRVWIAKEVYVESFDKKQMATGCAPDALRAIQSGAQVCAVDSAIVAAGDGATVFAIGFRSNCVRPLQEESAGHSAEKLRLADDVKWTTWIKDTLDLIHVDRQPARLDP